MDIKLGAAGTAAASVEMFGDEFSPQKNQSAGMFPNASLSSQWSTRTRYYSAASRLVPLCTSSALEFATEKDKGSPGPNTKYLRSDTHPHYFTEIAICTSIIHVLHVYIFGPKIITTLATNTISPPDLRKAKAYMHRP
jgi:hypothetical protein